MLLLSCLSMAQSIFSPQLTPFFISFSLPPIWANGNGEKRRCIVCLGRSKRAMTHLQRSKTLWLSKVLLIMLWFYSSLSLGKSHIASLYYVVYYMGDSCTFESLESYLMFSRDAFRHLSRVRGIIGGVILPAIVFCRQISKNLQKIDLQV